MNSGRGFRGDNFCPCAGLYYAHGSMRNILQQFSSGHSGILMTYSNSGPSLVLEVSYIWGVWWGSPPHKVSIASEDVKMRHMKYNIVSGGYYKSPIFCSQKSTEVVHLIRNIGAVNPVVKSVFPKMGYSPFLFIPIL